MDTKVYPVKAFDVYLCFGKGRKIPGTSRHANSVSWVAIERGPFDPRREPEGEYDTTRYIGNYPGCSKQDAIASAKDVRKARKKS